MRGRSNDIETSGGTPQAGARGPAGTVSSWLNRGWRGYNEAIWRLVGPAPRTTLFDPHFHGRHHFNRELRSVAGGDLGRLLDIGCGDKPFRSFLSPRRYVGVDLLRFGGGMVGAVAAADVFADGLRLPFRSGAFDTVVAFQVLEHTPLPGQVLGEAHRVLRPGGRLIVTVPQSYPMHGVPHDFYRYTAHGLRYLLEQAGFRVERIRPNGSFGAYVALMSNIYLFQHFFEFRERYWVKAALGVLKIVLTPLILLAVFAMNAFGLLIDRLFDDPYFTANYTALATRPEAR
jgi:SAM-dependent methyltransferase